MADNTEEEEEKLKALLRFAQIGQRGSQDDSDEAPEDFDQIGQRGSPDDSDEAPEDFAQNLNLLGTPGEEEAFDPTAVAGLGLGSGFVANQIAQNTAARQGFELVGQPRTTSTAGRLMGGTAPQYTGATPPPRVTLGTQIVPTGQAPAVQGMKPAQVTSVSTPGTQLATAGRGSRLLRPGNLNPYVLGYTLADIGTEAVTGEGLSEQIGTKLGNLLGTAIYGDRSQPAITPEQRNLMARGINPITGNPNPLETDNTIALEPLVRYSDPIRSTFTMPDGTVIMERESGERFTPTAEQLQSFTETMQQTSQPTATGLGVGGSEGVVFGGGQAPMGVEATRAALQERFGAPTISAIQALPEGQGLGMQVDPQGRMLTPSADRSSYEAESAAREARIAERDLRPGETQTERDTRIAQSRTQGATTGGLKMSDAVELAGGDRDLARTMVVRSRLGMDPMTGKKEEEPFKPEQVEIGGKKYIQLAPKYFQEVKEDTPTVTGLQATLDALQADLEAGRLKPEEYDIAVQNAKDAYIQQGKKPTGGDDDAPLFPTDSNAGTTDISTIPDSAKEMLRKNPSLREFFDQKYGAGVAAQVLGE